MPRIEEFTKDGKNIMWIDFSGFKATGDFCELIEMVKQKIAKYPEHSVYTITNIENTMYDTRIKEIFAEYMKHNQPYVKYGVLIGLDGIKKMISKLAITLSGRTNIEFAFTREEALEYISRRD
jgi:hypothetical protein